MPTLTRSRPDASRPAASRRRWWTVGAAALALALPLALPPHPAPAAAAASDTFVKTFAPENERSGSGRTAAQAVTDAQRFDVIVARQDTYRGNVPRMQAANPDLDLLVYTNGTFAQRSEGGAFPDSWYLRDQAGRKVVSQGFGNYLMNPSNPGWVRNRTEFCRAQMRVSTYPGCMLDMLGTAPTMPDYVSSPPVNPATGTVWTPVQWQRATTALARAVDAATSGPIWGNGYGSGSRYFSSAWGPSRVLSGGVHGALTENWIRTSQQPLTTFHPESRWKESVDQLVDLGRGGEETAVMVKLWASGSAAQKDRYHRYALASFMLGSDGASSFHASFSDGDALAGHRYWDADVGAPKGAYHKSGGVYRRPFQRGTVLVNPTDTTRTVALEGRYRDLSGTVRTSVTLGPNTGEVLTLAG